MDVPAGRGTCPRAGAGDLPACGPGRGTCLRAGAGKCPRAGGRACGPGRGKCLRAGSGDVPAGRGGGRACGPGRGTCLRAGGGGRACAPGRLGTFLRAGAGDLPAGRGGASSRRRRAGPRCCRPLWRRARLPPSWWRAGTRIRGARLPTNSTADGVRHTRPDSRRHSISKVYYDRVLPSLVLFCSRHLLGCQCHPDSWLDS